MDPNTQALVQTLAQGLLTGGIYALIGTGLSLIFGVMRVINFAHGDFLAVGMFIALFLFQRLHLDPYLSLLIAAPIGFGLGYLVQRFLLARLGDRLESSSMLATLGIGLILSNGLLLGFGAQPQSINVAYATKTFALGGIQISLPLLIAGLGTVLAIVLLNLFLYRTELGRAVRATAQNPLGAELQGVNTNWVQAVVFGLGVAFAVVAGVLLLPLLYAFPTVGENYTLKAFVVTVLGGLGNLPGAIAGGLILGIIESLGAYYLSNNYRDAYGLVVFLVVLLLRPEGLFGRTVKRV
ncbi:branched-chain amino acid ABC transporter permease (plasmid) [Deinococcus psychrotolerans]|uniref:Branched-chain amino acid ABC transporter permease n=1 Tax=Deinococcus psychrotolerans TaxID=2489213 RepID=A0A3G8YU35_9DEIO|nr:branched-chain amino acid ABC transporter permease [Deinococcus psychrotolerans]AZI44746.1 branched-chain amino acid ABC transporter permease [Deinococcus psychrotolerans]